MLGLGAMGGFRLGAAPMAMPLASAICRLLALGLPVETRLAVLKQQPEHDETARRALESDDGASFVTVAQAEAIVVEHVADAVVEMHGELAAANRVAAQSLANTTEHFGAWIQQLEHRQPPLARQRSAPHADSSSELRSDGFPHAHRRMRWLPAARRQLVVTVRVH